MKTGRIVEIKGKYAIVLNKSIGFEKILKKEDMSLGQDIYYFEEDLYIPMELFGYRLTKNRLVFASFIMFMLMLVGTGIVNISNIQLQRQEVFAYISIDINPSVELGVDKSKTVVSYTALNQDGKSIISEKLIGLDIKVALDMLLSAAKEQGFLFDNDSIMITSTKVKYKDVDNTEEEAIIEAEVDDALDTYMEKARENYSFIYYKGDVVKRLEAKEQGLSLGKYTMLKFYNEVSNEVPLSNAEIRELKMTEITKMIESKKEKEQLQEKFKENKIVQYKSKDLTELEEKENNGNGKNEDKINSNNGKGPNSNGTDTNIDNKGAGKQKNAQSDVNSTLENTPSDESNSADEPTSVEEKTTIEVKEEKTDTEDDDKTNENNTIDSESDEGENGNGKGTGNAGAGGQSQGGTGSGR